MDVTLNIFINLFLEYEYLSIDNEQYTDGSDITITEEQLLTKSLV